MSPLGGAARSGVRGEPTSTDGRAERKNRSAGRCAIAPKPAPHELVRSGSLKEPT